MVVMMMTTDGPTGNATSASGGVRSDERRGVQDVTEPPAQDQLEVAASHAGTDPCDVACEAMPAHLLGELTPSDNHWLLHHTDDCGYCKNELHRYHQTVDVLDRCHEVRIAEIKIPSLPVALRRRPAQYARIESPIGPLFVAASGEGLCEIDFARDETEATFRRRLAERGFDPQPRAVSADRATERAVEDAATQLTEYFQGQRDHFHLPLDLSGVTPFTRSVLEATATVPFGQLSTYRSIAERIGKPGATRAVGNALGRNPIPVVVPCHRIVRSDASLGGYTGGLDIKQHLLALEGVSLA